MMGDIQLVNIRPKLKYRYFDCQTRNKIISGRKTLHIRLLGSNPFFKVAVPPPPFKIDEIVHILEPWENKNNRPQAYSVIGKEYSNTSKNFLNALNLPLEGCSVLLVITGVMLKKISQITDEEAVSFGIGKVVIVKKNGDKKVAWKSYLGKEIFESPRMSLFSYVIKNYRIESLEQLVWIFSFKTFQKREMPLSNENAKTAKKKKESI